MKYRLHSGSVPERQFLASDNVIHFQRKRKKKRRPPKPDHVYRIESQSKSGIWEWLKGLCKWSFAL